MSHKKNLHIYQEVEKPYYLSGKYKDKQKVNKNNKIEDLIFNILVFM